MHKVDHRSAAGPHSMCDAIGAQVIVIDVNDIGLKIPDLLFNVFNDILLQEVFAEQSGKRVDIPAPRFLLNTGRNIYCLKTNIRATFFDKVVQKTLRAANHF